MAGLDDVDLDSISPEELKAIIDADPRVIAAKRQIAQQAAEHWKSISPVHHGDYRDSIAVHQDGTHVWVEASDFKAHWIEYGTTDTPEFAPRQKTDDHMKNYDFTIEL